MDVIRPELSKLSALELENLPYYTLKPANMNQSAPNFLTIYMTNRSRMSFILVLIGLEHLELFVLELGKIAEFDFAYTLASSSYKYEPISTKHGQNEYDHKISDEVDYGCNQTRTVWVICLWIRKFAMFDFVYTLASANINQSVPNCIAVYMTIRSRMS